MKAFQIVLIFTLGCAGLPSAEGPIEFELSIGESIGIPGAAGSVTFEAVPEDSRCPSDVVCVWAGDAAVRLRITSGHSADTTVDLHTTLEPDSFDFGDTTLRLIQLRPDPTGTSQIPITEYRAQLRVRID